MDPQADSRIYELGQSLGRLEGQVEQLTFALAREHEERVAHMAHYQKRSEATDKRVETILDRLAQQISTLSQVVETNKTEIENLETRRTNGIDATRWFIGFGFTVISVVLALLTYNQNRIRITVEEDNQFIKQYLHENVLPHSSEPASPESRSFSGRQP